MNNVLIIGAASAIAEATARIFAERGANLLLTGRNRARLESLAADLQLRGAQRVATFIMDVNETGLHEELLTHADQAFGDIDIVLIASGTLAGQRQCQASPELTIEELNTNCINVIALLTLLANRFEKRKKGCIAVISSVAGDRGRQSNYVYGTAKAALSTFLQGLRNRLSRSGVQVLTIKPGFVATPMTAGFKKGFLWAQPSQIAKGIVRGIDRKSDIIYLPFFWRAIMTVIKLIPEKIFKRMSL